MATIEELLADLQLTVANNTSASQTLVGTVNNQIAGINAAIAIKENEVDAFLASARSDFPFLNLLSSEIFTLTTSAWPGHTYAENGTGAGENAWDYDESFLVIDPLDPVAAGLINQYELSRFNIHIWRYRKITITKKGSGSFSTGLPYSNAGGGKVTGGFMVKKNDEEWKINMQSKETGAMHQGDWGATYSLNDFVVGDTVCFAMPFACPGRPDRVPFPGAFISTLNTVGS